MEFLDNWGSGEELDQDEGLPKRPLRSLILTPTRELAIQIKNHLEAAAKFTDIKVSVLFLSWEEVFFSTLIWLFLFLFQIAVVVGGMAAQKQIRMLNYGPEIVVATPGRLWDLIQEGNPHLSQVKKIK